MGGKRLRITLFVIGLGVMAASAYALDSQPLQATGKAFCLTVLETILRGFDAAPALMLCFALVVAVPLAVLALRAVAWLRRAPEQTRRYRRRPLSVAEEDVSANIVGDAIKVAGQAHASVEVVGERGAHYAILRDMLRIGREDDNDIRIPSNAVHRYHAAIHREDIGDYWITDLSGTDGNGLIVNGQRCGDARLNDGDLIELGPGRLRFHAGLL